MNSQTRYVLGFDASCFACGKISERISEIAGGLLEVLPISSEEFLELSGSKEPCTRPTLLVVSRGIVRAYQGPMIVKKLIGRLGVRATLKISSALVELSKRPSLTQGNNKGMSRANFLTAAGGSVIGIMLLGSSAYAESFKAKVEAMDPTSAFRGSLKSTEMSISMANLEAKSLQMHPAMPSLASIAENFGVRDEFTELIKAQPKMVRHTAKPGETMDIFLQEAGELFLTKTTVSTGKNSFSNVRLYKLVAEENSLRLIATIDDGHAVAKASACPSKCTSGMCKSNPCEMCAQTCCDLDINCAINCCGPCAFSCGNPMLCAGCLLLWCPTCSLITSKCCRKTQASCINNC